MTHYWTLFDSIQDFIFLSVLRWSVQLTTTHIDKLENLTDGCKLVDIISDSSTQVQFDVSHSF